jgi:hypothetical protein
MNSISINFDFSKLSNLYLGKFGEQLIKLYFLVNGIDAYEPTIDDKGIDFIARIEADKYLEIQVKTIRLKKESYIYITKETWNFKLNSNKYVAFVVIDEDPAPIILLIPTSAWQTDLKSKILSNRDYEGLKSKPEWGITFNKKNLMVLKEKYSIEKTMSNF